MALNRSAVHSRTSVTKEVEGVDATGDTDGEFTVAIPELKQVDSVADVSVVAYGSDDSDSDQGFVAVPTGLGEDDDGNVEVTCRLYQGGGDGTPLADAGVSDVDHVLVKAEGL